MTYPKNQIQYIVACISEFARAYELSIKDAYDYLSRYKGLEFLCENFESEHTLSFDDAVDDLRLICYKNGGVI